MEDTKQFFLPKNYNLTNLNQKNYANAKLYENNFIYQQKNELIDNPGKIFFLWVYCV